MALVVVTRPIIEAGLEPLRSEHEVRVHDAGPGALLTEDQLIELGREADALLTVLSDPIRARVINACPNLKVISQYAVGYDNIDLEAARKQGVVVTNTPGVLTDATADFAFALLLAVARRVLEADRYVRDGLFQRWETTLLLGSDLRGKTIGIVGMGRIGLAMARRAVAFGMHVIYHNRRRVNPSDERLLNARYVSFDELLEQSDVVSVHSPLNKESRGLFNADAFRRMKSTALLINTARGPVVDEEALVEALRSGQIQGAGLDVFEREPIVHPGLLKLDRVVLAPHLASATVETRTAMGLMCSEAILAVLNGDATIPYQVK
jgi:glyoxylate reductase